MNNFIQLIFCVLQDFRMWIGHIFTHRSLRSSIDRSVEGVFACDRSMWTWYLEASLFEHISCRLMSPMKRNA